MEQRDFREILVELISALRGASEEEIVALLKDGELQGIFAAIFNPHDGTSRLYIDRLLENRDRATLIATLYASLVKNYAVKGRVGDTVGFVSPHVVQWYDDGVMFRDLQERRSRLSVIALASYSFDFESDLRS